MYIVNSHIVLSIFSKLVKLPNYVKLKFLNRISLKSPPEKSLRRGTLDNLPQPDFLFIGTKLSQRVKAQK